MFGLWTGKIDSFEQRLLASPGAHLPQISNLGMKPKLVAVPVVDQRRIAFEQVVFVILNYLRGLAFSGGEHDLVVLLKHEVDANRFFLGKLQHPGLGWFWRR